jgi:hypothetical protein
VNQYQQYNIKKAYDMRLQLVLFWIWQISLGFLLPLTSIFVIWRSLGSEERVVGFISKLGLHLSIAILFGGFWVLLIIFWNCWDEYYSEMMQEKYFRLPANSDMTVEIIIPEGYDYDTHNMISFFFYFKNSFRSHDVTKANIFRFGKWHSQLTFDFIIQHKKLKIYTTFPRKKYTQFLEGIIRLFPGLTINQVEDPYASWPIEWKEGNKIGPNTEFAGFSFGLRKEGFHPIFKLKSLPRIPAWSATDNLLRAVKESVNEDEIIILQYTFMASPNELPNEKYLKGYEKWRQSLYDFFSPKRNGKIQGEALEVILPEKEKIKNEAYHWRANQTLVQTAIRMGGFTTRNRAGNMENLLDKYAYIFSNDTARNGGQWPEKKHITATSQKYYRHLNRAPEFQYVYDRYIYPTKKPEAIPDQVAGPLYEKYYFPNENRWRKKVNYKCILERNIEGPWNGFEFYSDPIAGAGLLQFPVSAYNPGSYYEKNIEGPAVNLQDEIYDRDEEI